MVSERWLLVRLPAFRLERLGHLADAIAGLIAEEHGTTRVIAVTPGAWGVGLRAGMSATEARALVREVVLEPLDVEAEDRDRRALLAVFERLSDQVLPMVDDAVAQPIIRTAALFGGEAGVLAAARELAESLGHACCCVIADDPRAALAIAVHDGVDRIVDAGASAAALADLPLETVRPSPDLLRAWREIGLHTLGELAMLDAAAIAGRYGEEGIDLHKLACGRARDRRADAVIIAKDPDGLVERAVLADATSSLDPVLFVLPGLIGRISEALGRRDAMAIRLVVRLGLQGGGIHLARVRVGRPTAWAPRLHALVRDRLRDLRVDAPVVEVVVAVEEACASRPWQPGLLDRTEAVEPLPDLVARLTDVLGEDAVFTPALAPCWRPEAAWRAQVPDRGSQPSLWPEIRTERGRIDPVAVQDVWETDTSARPGLLRPPTDPIEVRVAHGLPIAVRVEAGWAEVRRRRGPECLSGEWWRPDGGFDREYWVVDIGVTAWLFRDRASDRWFWHGWFD